MIYTKAVLIFALVLGLFTCCFAQQDFYDQNQIQEIKIYFKEANWDHILDSLYVKGDEDRMLGSIEVNGELLDSVGIRYKGFSSVSVDRKKNPFNIKLNYIKGNQQYDNIDKIKLSNVIQDPSFVREVLSYEVGRKYMPSSRANYAKLYINDEYWGLYVNVESVDKDMLSGHFSSNDNTLVKCNPASLDFDGENSNLGNHLGTDTTAYFPFYDMKSDIGWKPFVDMIVILNINPNQVLDVLNVDRVLWMHAFNYVLINFDSYVGYAQNYYMYEDVNGHFNPILWDLNQSFASYRLTDASEHFNGFSIAQAKTMDPLLHINSVSVQARPLIRKLLENDVYKRMYLAHMRTIVVENFANGLYKERAMLFQDIIDASVLADDNKFYSYQAFQDNLESTVSDLIEYPGIFDLMDDRADYLLSYEGVENPPSVDVVSADPSVVNIGDAVWINAKTTGAYRSSLLYRFNHWSAFTQVTMFDDGMHNDGGAADGEYGYQITNVGGTVEYYVYTENNTSGAFAPARAAYEYYEVPINAISAQLAINEFMASNGSTVQDEVGEFDDWIELFNGTGVDVDLNGMFLSDDIDLLEKWTLPNITLESGDYLIVWADGDEDQGDLHASFKLSAGGEMVLLSNSNGVIIDSVSFGLQQEDESYARKPNGTGFFRISTPTFNANNTPTSIDNLNSLSFSLWPNPASGNVSIQMEEVGDYTLTLSNMYGQILWTKEFVNYQGGNLDLTSIPSDVYCLKVNGVQKTGMKKIVINK